MSFNHIEWQNDSLVLLDQRKLPVSEEYITCKNYEDVAVSIENMTVRGAPAIGVCAAFGITVAFNEKPADELDIYFEKVHGRLHRTRPTAVNLFWALKKMRLCFNEHKNNYFEALKKALLKEALDIQTNDIEMNHCIGKHGSKLIKNNDTILTICNAGALATAGFGTALGVIRQAHIDGKNIKVYALETRPLLQGARLTAWELQKDGIDVTLITDGMAGHLMQKGEINCVICGSDRVAANGDTANKIGTYSQAVLAKYHKIPFYPAMPSSTIDLNCPCGSEIPIEERERTEITHVFGKQIAPKDIKIYNPAFDVTPAELITALITEKGVIYPPFENKIREIFC
ncbi:MAG: S-methyl-5-thioribose-1-phosphate isomerase [Pseudomonadota bacterium]